MELVIGANEYTIDGFNFSVNFGNTDERENLDVTLSNSIDLTNFTMEIGTIFNGTLAIHTSDTVYNFENYELQQVNTSVDSRNKRTNVRFAKGNLV